MSELIYNNTLDDIPGPFLKYTKKTNTNGGSTDGESTNKRKNGLDTRDMVFMMLLLIMMSY